MANRKYQSKFSEESNEFIHVDLLPNVRRPRQFNVNILFIVLFAVILSWLLIYIPLSSRQDTLNEVLAEKNNLQNQLELVTDERVGLGIDQNRVNFYNAIERAIALHIDFENYVNIFENRIDRYNGTMKIVRFDAISQRFHIQVELGALDFQELEWDFEELAFVTDASSSPPLFVAGDRYTSIFTLEVDFSAE